MSERHEIQDTLEKYFHLTDFRPNQSEIIQAIIEGRDVLAVMATGGGKSLCYQLPAVMFPGMTVVISPLISLMKDQVDSLSSQGVQVAMLNSSLSYDKRKKTEDDMMRIRNLGRKSLDEVKNKLAEMSLGFKPSDE